MPSRTPLSTGRSLSLMQPSSNLQRDTSMCKTQLMLLESGPQSLQMMIMMVSEKPTSNFSTRPGSNGSKTGTMAPSSNKWLGANSFRTSKDPTNHPERSLTESKISLLELVCQPSKMM